jgi:hypothetical protein
MKNHVHLALQVTETPLSKLMQSLSQRYTVWFNHRHERVGHLFQGRYKDILVDSDQYLLELIRYIHLNPVRANLVADPENYSYSSHRAYSGLVAAPPWLTLDWGQSQFEDYLEFMGGTVKEEMEQQLRNGNEAGRILGGERFVQELAVKTGNNHNKRSLTPEELVEVVAEVFKLEAWEITGPSRARDLAEARATVAWLGMDECNLTLTEISKYLHRDLPTMSKQVKNLRNRPPSQKLSKAINRVRLRL